MAIGRRLGSPREEGEQKTQADNAHVPVWFSDQSLPLHVNNLPGLSVT